MSKNREKLPYGIDASVYPVDFFRRKFKKSAKKKRTLVKWKNRFPTDEIQSEFTDLIRSMFHYVARDQ